MKIALITWHDAYSIDDWTNIKEISKENEVIISCGVVVRNEPLDENIVIATNVCAQFEKTSCIMQIPRGMIRDILIVNTEDLHGIADFRETR